MELTVREATHEDVESLLPLSRSFHHAARLHDYAEWDPEKWAKWIVACIEADAAVCLVVTNGATAPIGFTTAVKVPSYWDPEIVVCQETVLWSVPEYRGKGVGSAMLNAITEWAKYEGCAVMAVGTQQHMEPKKTAAKYRKLGFELTEKAFARRL